MSVQLKHQISLDVGLRIALWSLFLYLEHLEPLVRKIHPNEIWKYQYPDVESYVSPFSLWFIVFLVPMVFILTTYATNKSRIELREALLSVSLNYGLVGVVTQFLKLIVGRPRPNFYYRCFPSGQGSDYEACAGIRHKYMDGRKSFPSGHSSLIFSSMVFLSLYLAGKLKVFNECGRGITWRFCTCLVPLVLASAVAISRTCDYHHHWDDVMFGSILGSVFAYACYRQHFPPLDSIHSDIPYVLHVSEIRS